LDRPSIQTNDISYLLCHRTRIPSPYPRHQSPLYCDRLLRMGPIRLRPRPLARPCRVVSRSDQHRHPARGNRHRGIRGRLPSRKGGRSVRDDEHGQESVRFWIDVLHEWMDCQSGGTKHVFRDWGDYSGGDIVDDSDVRVFLFHLFPLPRFVVDTFY
jgi:hypothetical protein